MSFGRFRRGRMGCASSTTEVAAVKKRIVRPPRLVSTDPKYIAQLLTTELASPATATGDGLSVLTLLQLITEYAVSVPAYVRTLAGSQWTGFADGIGSGAQFSLPLGLCLYTNPKPDPSGGPLSQYRLLIADTRNHRVRRIEFINTIHDDRCDGQRDDARVTTLIGDGLGMVSVNPTTDLLSAHLSSPAVICADPEFESRYYISQAHGISQLD